MTTEIGFTPLSRPSYVAPEATGCGTSNPVKKFFLLLAKQTVQNVSNQRDGDGITFARKAMIRCGMSLYLNCRWEVEQLTPALRRIVDEQKAQFYGELVLIPR